jgi:DNA-binding transcriptional LysR family regulator
LLTVTTSAPFASLWLVPRLWRFVGLHPEVDVRCVAANQRLDLERERLDLAIRWAGPGSTVPGGERLIDVEIFPACAPGFAREHPLDGPADLAAHVMLELETLTSGGPWSEWGPWLDANELRDLKPAGMLRFSHYDQVVQAAIDGSGVAVGRTPHFAHHLREELLVEPLGQPGRLAFGAYYVLIAPRSVARPVVTAFVAWLREEALKESVDRAAQPKSPPRARRY